MITQLEEFAEMGIPARGDNPTDSPLGRGRRRQPSGWVFPVRHNPPGFPGVEIPLRIRRKRLVGLFVVVLALGLAAQALAQAPITFQYFYDDTGQLVKVV